MRISPSGRARLDELLAEERAGIDSAALAAAYGDFQCGERRFQSPGDGLAAQGGPRQPNSHGTPIRRRIGRHGRCARAGAADHRGGCRAAAAIGRLSAKLCTALDKVQAGETAWLTRPLVDSYHTVWFELHEELILASGLTREEAARSGDAQ